MAWIILGIIIVVFAALLYAIYDAAMWADAMDAARDDDL